MARRTDAPIRLCLVMNTALVGGAETVLLEVFRHLDPAKVTPSLVCLREPGPLAAEFEASGFEVTVFDRHGWRDLRETARLYTHFRRTRPDVVLVPHFQRAPLVLGPWFARLARVPATVIAVHGMGMVAIGSRVLPRPVVETLFVTDALALLAPSQSRYLHAQEGVGRFPWRRTAEHLVPNGIRVPAPPTADGRAEVRAELGYDDDAVVVAVMVARLAPLKGHAVMLRALAQIQQAQLAERHPDLRLLVVGEGPERPGLEALAAELGVTHRVRFTGLRRDVLRLLAGADLGVLPSAHEAVPISVIEQMAMGLPVVVTDVGGLPDVVGDGREGYVVPSGDVDALAGRVGELAADTETRRALGKAARRRAESEFSISGSARAYEDMLEAVLAR